MNVRHYRPAVVAVGLAVLTAVACPVIAGNGSVAPSAGESVYVPVYSHIYYGDRDRRIDLTATVSIRNTDPTRPIQIVSANYHDSSGKRVRTYLDKPVELGPLASTRIVVKESDRSGGSGASFVVRWRSDAPASPPIIEAVMVGTAGNRGMTFASRGRAMANPVVDAAPAD